jgi:hypothetical protein
MKLLTFCLALLLAGCASAFAQVACPASDNGVSCHGSATSTPSSAAGANTGTGRCMLYIQNTGGTNSMNVAFGSGDAAGSEDILLAAGGYWSCGNYQGKGCPNGDVSVYSASGTTYVYVASSC